MVSGLLDRLFDGSAKTLVAHLIEDGRLTAAQRREILELLRNGKGESPMSISLALVASLWDVLGWTMLHFLWAGALVAFVARVVLWAVRRRSPHVRYAVALAAIPAPGFHAGRALRLENG